MTGHFVDFSGNHLVLNLGALALLLHLLPRLSRREFIWLVVVAPVAISVCLLLTRPQLKMYGGLSGWLSGLFVFAALAHWRHEGWTKYIYLVGLSLFVFKTLIESSTSRSLFVILDNGVVVEPAAHVIGAVIAGFGVLLVRGSIRRIWLANPPRGWKTKRRFPEEPPDIFWGCVAQAPDQFAKGNKKE